LYTGGGDVAYHSSVSACHGSFPTRGPLRQLLAAFQTKTRSAMPMRKAPRLEMRLYHSKSPSRSYV
jgi:hypothetical protein